MGSFQQVLLTLTGATGFAPVFDDFTRADDASSLGRATSGQTWIPLGGTWGINSNKGYLSNVTGLKPAYIDRGLADTTIQVTLTKTDATNTLNRMGIAFRITDANNFLFAYFLTLSQMRLGKIVAGVGSTIVTVTGLTETSGDALKVVTSGNSIQVYQNTTLLTTQTDSFNNTATKHGLYFEVGGSNFAVCRWDDFSIA